MCHNVTEIDISWADSDFCIWFVVNFAIYKYAFQAVWRRPRRPVKEAVAPLKKKSQSEPPPPSLTPNSEIPLSKHCCVLLYLLTAPRSLILIAVIVS